MDEKILANQRGQSLVLVAAAMVILVGFVALAVDLGNAYYARRTAQNAADGAALAGVSEMATSINDKKPKGDNDVKEAMDDFAERNGIAYLDTDGDNLNDNVEGYYVDASGNRLPGPEVVGDQLNDYLPDGAYGVEAISHITATSFFGGIFGVRGYPIQARAVSLVKLACSADCVVPIVTNKDTLFDNQDNPKIGACYNIWSESYDIECDLDGDGVPDDPDLCPASPGSYGWVAWTWQETVCQDCSRPCPVEQGHDPCSSETLATNLLPDNCASGFVTKGDWVANTTGIKNADVGVRCMLDYYLGVVDLSCPYTSSVPTPFTIVVYDGTNASYFPNANPAACGGVVGVGELTDPSAWGLHYQVAGFAQMQILGYELSQGSNETVSAQINDLEYLGGLWWDPNDPRMDLSDGFDPMVDCWNPPTAQQSGNRITAYFMDYVESYSSNNDCYDPWSTLRASPRLIQ